MSEPTDNLPAADGGRHPCEESRFRCGACGARGRPANFASEPKCAFNADGTFNPDNWQCVTALSLRHLAGEGQYEPSEDHIWIRRKDTSYAALYVPPSEDDIPDGDKVGEFRGGGFIAMTWYKHRGCTDMIARIDAWDRERKCHTVRPITLSEAESAIANIAEQAGRLPGAAGKL